jgi:transcriptional regulator with XRE-family HTH domain
MDKMTADQLGEVFRKNLVEFRQSKKLSQIDLSQLSGIPQPQISALERGETKPNTKTIARLATALQIAPWTLLFTPENAIAAN